MALAFTFEKIQNARKRITPYIMQTPLLRLQNLDAYLGCEVYVKAECMQITGSFKLRGAMNKILSLPPDELSHGIVAASSGNHGKAIAYAARLLGTKATIVMPNTAPQIKVDAIRSLGAEIIACDVSERFEIAEKICRERNSVMIPPFNDELIMAGQGTVGLEIIEQCPDLTSVVIPVSGGGLISGTATAIKSISPCTRIYGTEPAALPRYSASLKARKPVKVTPQKSIADALVAQIPGTLCFPHVAAHTDGFAAVDDTYILKGWKLLLIEGKLLCEPSSAIGIGAILQGLIPVRKSDKICFLISGGSVALEQLDVLKNITL